MPEIAEESYQKLICMHCGAIHYAYNFKYIIRRRNCPVCGSNKVVGLLSKYNTAIQNFDNRIYELENAIDNSIEENVEINV